MSTKHTSTDSRMNKPLITDQQTLVSAATEYGSPIKTYDDGYGPLWVYCTSTGVTGVVRAMSWEDALEIVYDEILVPISVDDLPDAYGAFDKLVDMGFSGAQANLLAGSYFRDSTKNANHTGAWDRWALVEGYHYQANAGGETGIVSIDLNGEALDKLTAEMLEQLNITLEIKEDES